MSGSSGSRGSRGRRGFGRPGETRLPGPGDDPRPGRAAYDLGSGIRVYFDFDRTVRRPSELGLRDPGKDPRPAAKRAWALELPGTLPAGARLQGIHYRGLRFAVDVQAPGKETDSILQSVRSTIGRQGSGFTIEPF